MKTMADWAPADGDTGKAWSGGAAATVLTQVNHHPVCRRRKGAVHRCPISAGEKDHDHENT